MILLYDLTSGSGSLLLTVGRFLSETEQKELVYYGQEKNTATYNLTRMNLLLHGVRPEKMEIRNGDTLAEDWPDDPLRPHEAVQFDAVVMNPPYSLKNWNKADLKVSDPRFELAGVLPPSSKGDFAFLLHGLYHLGQQGTMAIVLPHGVLFRGGSEGEIRKRLLEKNYLDAIIGMPANLFTNTGIPVVILILKKNREPDAPVLFIDASKNFVKVGKQNALLEKDIARITDAYVNRSEVKGYSHLADRDEIIDNDYNLNIPRYVDSSDQEIPHDVDAHLYGGIPQKNIDDFKVLRTVVPHVLERELETIRPGYVKLKQSMDELRDAVLNDEAVLRKAEELNEEIKTYVDKYWTLLRQSKDRDHLSQIRDTMLDEIKALLDNYRFIDIYDGYQKVAEIWNESLKHDMELITNGDFYEIARSRVPNWVTKGSGSKRREVQEGWVGTIIPNELIVKHLYAAEEQAIRDKELRISEIDSELNDLLDAAKVEDSDENTALFDSIKKDSEGEPGNSFDFKVLKQELKASEKGSPEQKLLKKVSALNDEMSMLKREVKSDTKDLDDAVQNRIPELTNEEIDVLVYDKWFGKSIPELVSLIENPLKEELDVLAMLNERYAETIDEIDAEIAKVEAELKAMMAELVVTHE